jgi:hypothetical protein
MFKQRCFHTRSLRRQISPLQLSCHVIREKVCTWVFDYLSPINRMRVQRSSFSGRAVLIMIHDPRHLYVPRAQEDIKQRVKFVTSALTNSNALPSHQDQNLKWSYRVRRSSGAETVPLSPLTTLGFNQKGGGGLLWRTLAMKNGILKMEFTSLCVTKKCTDDLKS